MVEQIHDRVELHKRLLALKDAYIAKEVVFTPAWAARPWAGWRLCCGRRKRVKRISGELDHEKAISGE